MNKKLLIVCILLMIAADMLTCLANNLHWSFWNYGILIKSPLEFYFLVEMYRFKKINKYLMIPVALLVLWSIGISTTYLINGGLINYRSGAHFVDDETTHSAFSTSFIVYNRYLLFFLMYPVMLYYKDDQYFVTSCKKIIEAFFYFNSSFILLGFIFKLSVFASYNFKEIADLGFDARFGYKGLVYGINEVTGVYFLGLAYTYREVFVNKNNKKIILLIMIIVSSLLTGAKGCGLSFVLLTIYYFAQYKPRIFLITVLPLVIVGVIYILNVDFIGMLSDTLNIGFHDDVSNVAFLNPVLTFLTSGRNAYIYYNWVYMFDHWNYLNWIFGDGVLYSEADMVDIYYFFGLGAITYLYLYFKMYFAKDKTKDAKFVFAFLLFLAVISGHIIRSAVVPVYLCLFLITQTNGKKEEVEQLG